jgi:hypothetical protein
MEQKPFSGASAPVSRTRFDHCHISLYAGIAFAVVGAAATIWDSRAGGSRAGFVDLVLAGVLGGLTVLYAFLSLLGRTYEHSDRVWYRNFTPEGRVAIILLVLTVAAGAAKTLVGENHQAKKALADAEADSIRIAKVHRQVDKRADSTVAALQASERRSLDKLQTKSDEIVGLVNADINAVSTGLLDFLQMNSESLSGQQRQQVLALMTRLNTADDSTTQRTARLRSYIEDYASRSTELNGRMLAELLTLTNPADGVIRTATLRTTEARDSVVRAVEARFGVLQSGFTDTYGGISQSLAACKVDAAAFVPQLERFAQLVDSLSKLPATRPSVQAAQTQTNADSGRTTEGR